MSDIGNIIGSSFPPNVDKTSKYYKALVANYKVDSIDENNISKLGLIERLIYDATEYTQRIFGTVDFFNYDVNKMDKLDEYLFKHFITFLCLPQTKYFRTERVMQLCRLLFQRRNSGWGCKDNIEYIFSQAFNSSVYIVENGLTYADSLIENGDFEKGFSAWNSNVESPLSEDNPFCGNNAVQLYEKQNISQTVTLAAKQKYNFMFFVMGKVKVYVRNNLGEYWDTETNSWAGAEKFTTFETYDYENKVINYNTKDDADVITFTIESEMDTSYIDYVRLFQINYPCFNILLRTVIEKAEDSTDMVYGPEAKNHNDNIDDKIPGLDKSYEINYGYYGGANNNKAFFTGTDTGMSKDLQDFLLDYVRAAGIRGVYERVTVDRSKAEAYVDGKTLVVPYGNVADETFNNNKNISDKTFNA